MMQIHTAHNGPAANLTMSICILPKLGIDTVTRTRPLLRNHVRVRLCNSSSQGRHVPLSCYMGNAMSKPSSPVSTAVATTDSVSTAASSSASNKAISSSVSLT